MYFLWLNNFIIGLYLEKYLRVLKDIVKCLFSVIVNSEKLENNLIVY